MSADTAAIPEGPLPLTISDHFRELRSRLTVVVIVLLLASSVAFYFNGYLVDVLQRPFQQTLYYTSPAGGFTFTIATSLLFGAIISIPFLIYHTLAFIRPALPTSAVKRVWTMVATSLLLSATGLLFAYWVSLPAALNFLDIFNSSQIQPLIGANDYLSFISFYLLGFALLFEIPLIMLVINLVTPLSFRSLMRAQLPMVLVAFVIGAILTPTGDPLNQALMAGPIIVLYQVGIICIVIRRRRLRRKERVRTINGDIRTF